MHTFDVPDPILVDVALTVGSVHVIASDRRDATVTVRPSDASRDRDVDAADRAEVELVDDRLLIKATEPWRLLLGPNSKAGAVEIVLEVPTGSALHVDALTGNRTVGLGVIADVRTDGTMGDVEVKASMGQIHLDRTRRATVKTSGGDVTIQRAGGDVKVTGAGQIHLGAIEGTAEVKNINGPIWIGEVTGPVRARSHNGDIAVDRPGDEVVARTALGNVSIGAVRRGSISLRTGSGGIDVGVVTGTAVHIDAASKFGRVDSSLEATSYRMVVQDRLAGPDGAAQTAEIEAHTAYGDIVIHRATT
jgi:hypothetical protein